MEKTQQKNMEFEPSKVIKEMLKTLSTKRAKEIIRKRYGLSGHKRKTLESLGGNYSITRERVRQIEEDALKRLRAEVDLYSSQARRISDVIEKEGGLVSQEKLLDLLFSSWPDEARRRKEGAATILILELSDKFLGLKSKIFNKSWATKKIWTKLATETIEYLRKALEKKMTPLSAEEIAKLVQEAKILKQSPQIKKALWSYIDASSQIYSNPFGKWGLKIWPEITPKGARDKAYLVLREKSEPLHFRAITDFINKTNFKSKGVAYAQTVHNELIKSNKFVLVGRGTYALSEWGYKPGTVRQVIEDLLESAGRPMGKEEILKEVLNCRQVKRNTVILNLNNREYFKKTGKGKYTLV